MSYVDEVIELVVKKNPAEPEFHQAVKEAKYHHDTTVHESCRQ